MSLFVLTAAAVSILFLTVIQSAFILPSFRAIDIDDASRELSRVVAAVEGECEALATQVSDYGHWDDTLDFSRSGDPSYAENNLTAATFASIGVDIVAIYDREGGLLFGRELLEDGTLAEYRPELGSAASRLLAPLACPDTFCGLWLSPEGSCVAASSAILSTLLEGPSSGAFLMARRIDEDFHERLESRIGADFDFATVGRGGTAAPSGAAVASSAAEIPASPEDGISISEEGGYYIGRTALAGIDGLPILALVTRSLGDATDRGLVSAQAVRISISGLVVVMCAVMIGFMKRSITAPLAGMGSAMGSLALGDPLPDIVTGLAKKGDELGDLAKAFAKMDERLGQNRDEIIAANRGLETRVLERTRDLVAANERLTLMDQVFRNTSEGILVADGDERVVEVNEAFCAMTGYGADEIVGRDTRAFIDSGEGGSCFGALRKDGPPQDRWSGEVVGRKKDGNTFPAWLGASAIPDGEGNAKHFVAVSTDISALKAAQGELHRLAYFDSLTGLPNRALFMDRLAQIVTRSRRYNERAAIAFMDLDRFKYVNDSMGHAAGDALLVETARRLESRVRKSDTVCRIGGDEFTILIERIGEGADAGHIAADIIEAVNRPYRIAGVEICVGASVGIALFPDDDESPEGLTRKADAAMYAAKDAGRNTFHFASREAESKSRKRVELDAGLHRALENGEFFLRFQPKYSLDSPLGKARPVYVGAEALVRWTTPEGAPVPPSAFVPAAEDSGLIVPLGTWILEEACRRAAVLGKGGASPHVAVNISARQFEDPRLPDAVASALSAAGLPASALQLEITESMVMRDSTKAIRIMSELKEIGIGFAMDDFGTGYSSLACLGRFPVDYLKIDQAFVRDLGAKGGEPRRAGPAGEVVTAIISLARAFGIKTIAEGVETEEQFDILRANGCDQYQGYLLGKPMSAEELLASALAPHARERSGD